MIRYHDNGASFRDAMHIGSFHLEIDIHLAQQVFENGTAASATRSTVQIVRLFQRQQLAGERRHSSEKRSAAKNAKVFRTGIRWLKNGHGAIPTRAILLRDERQIKSQ